MTCLTPEQLAADGAASDPHMADCLVCRRAIAEQRELRELLRQLPTPTLARRDREAMAAELLARAELADDRAQVVTRRGRTVAVAGAGLAAAAVLALVLGREARIDSAAIELATSAPHAAPTNVTSPLPPSGRAVTPGAPVTADHAPATLVAPTPTEVVDAGSPSEPAPLAPNVRLRERTKTVVAGSRESAARLAVERDRLDPVPSRAQLALTEFRVGWTALRDGRNAEARAAFDRATDPVVAEDAAYWAAVASERAGDRVDAAARFTAFAARYPDSPRGAAARAAADRLR